MVHRSNRGRVTYVCSARGVAGISYSFSYEVKVVVSLLGDEDEMVRVWKVGGPGECQVRILLHTHSKKGSLLSRSEV